MFKYFERVFLRVTVSDIVIVCGECILNKKPFWKCMRICNLQVSCSVICMTDPSLCGSFKPLGYPQRKVLGYRTQAAIIFNCSRLTILRKLRSYLSSIETDIKLIYWLAFYINGVKCHSESK